MICPSCQADNDETADICFGCGRGLFALTEGSVLGGRYEIARPIGKGGMGMVYKAFDREFEEGHHHGGAAITIAVDFFVLDLNNFKLGTGAAGPAREPIGVFSDRATSPVRGGNIRGFTHGFLLEGATPSVAADPIVRTT